MKKLFVLLTCVVMSLSVFSQAEAINLKKMVKKAKKEVTQKAEKSSKAVKKSSKKAGKSINKATKKVEKTAAKGLKEAKKGAKTAQKSAKKAGKNISRVSRSAEKTAARGLKETQKGVNKAKSTVTKQAALLSGKKSKSQQLNYEITKALNLEEQSAQIQLKAIEDRIGSEKFEQAVRKVKVRDRKAGTEHELGEFIEPGEDVSVVGWKLLHPGTEKTAQAVAGKTNSLPESRKYKLAVQTEEDYPETKKNAVKKEEEKHEVKPVDEQNEAKKKAAEKLANDLKKLFSGKK